MDNLGCIQRETAAGFADSWLNQEREAVFFCIADDFACTFRTDDGDERRAAVQCAAFDGANGRGKTDEQKILHFRERKSADRLCFLGDENRLGG